MSTAIIIIACVLLLLAYAFDVSATFTKIPSVILLLILGGILRIAANSLNIFIPDLNPALPILGTIGLKQIQDSINQKICRCSSHSDVCSGVWTSLFISVFKSGRF